MSAYPQQGPLRADTARIFAEAISLHEKGRVQAADELYQRVLRIDPDHFGSLHYLGLIRGQGGRYDEAIALLRKAIAQNPRSAETHVNLAVVFELQGRAEQALTHCQHALAVKANFAEAYFAAGNALKALGRFEEAVVQFQNATISRPDYVEAYYNLGNILHAFKKYERAIEQYGSALRLRPDYPKALNNRGVALQELDRCQEADQDFARALALAPDYFEALINRGNAQLALARPADALTSFDKALALDPDNADTLYGQGIAAYHGDSARRGRDAWRYGRALASYGKAIALRPDDLLRSNEFFQEALDRLVAAGAIAAPQPMPAATRYPLAMYPDALRAAARCLSAAGIEPFLTGGTLLGAIRHGDFLNFDKDLDFGVDASVTPATLNRALTIDPDFKSPWQTGDDAPVVTFYWQDKVAIDFFRFFRASDHVWCGLHVGGHLMKWVHRPFALADFSWHGVTVQIPHDAGGFLTEAYGDWRTPNPYFGLFASPNIEGGFPPISENVAYAAIFLALWRQQQVKAAELCRQALALQPGHALIGALHDRLVTLSRDEAAPADRDAGLPHQGLGPAFDDSPG